MNSFTNTGIGLRLGRLAGALFAAMSMLALSAYSADLTLVGSGDTNWNTNLANMVWNDSGSPVAFQNGDNVLIDSTSFTGSKLTMDARVTPGKVEIDISGPLTLALTKFNEGLGVDTKSFTKNGAGTLFLEGVAGASGDTARGNAMTCGVDIVEGEIACVTHGFQNSLGPRTVPFWVRVQDGAALTFLAGNQTGSINMPECGIMLQLDSGSTLNFGTNAVTEAEKKLGALCLNTLMLNGGDIAVGPYIYIKEDKMIGGECVAKIYNTLWFAGNTPHAFGFAEGVYPGYKAYTLDGTFQNRKISLNPYSPVEFRVDDIDNDADGVDAYVDMKAFTWGTNTVGIYKSDIVKTGAGKLSFPTKPNTFTKTFLGDFTIREGTVEFCQQNFFPCDGANLQTLSVLTNATLRMTSNNVIRGLLTDMPNVNIVVDHGVLEFILPSDSGGALQAKDWVFDDATLNVHNKGMSKVVGVFYFKNSATFRGTRPLVMWPDETLATTCQAVHVHNGSRTKIDVADMTGDGRTDVVMGYHIWNGMVGTTTSDVLADSGFVKTGAGTFSVASVENKVSGVVTVSNGTMRVDGSLVTPESVKVVAGAYIGGTGTVANVEMEAGAGFAAPAGQGRPLTVEGDLALPATGVVNISNLGGYEGDDLPAAKLVTATGTLSGTENLANWTVMIDGEPVRTWKVAMSGNVVRATKNLGMKIIFK